MSSVGRSHEDMWSEWIWSNEDNSYYRWRKNSSGQIQYDYDQSSTQPAPDYEDNIEDERYPDEYENRATSSGNMNSESDPSQTSKKESRSSGPKKASSSKHKSTPSRSAGKSSSSSSKGDRGKSSVHSSSKASRASVRDEETTDQPHYTSEAGTSSYSPQEIRQNQTQPWKQHPDVRHEEETYHVSSNKVRDDQNRSGTGDLDIDNTGS